MQYTYICSSNNCIFIFITSNNNYNIIKILSSEKKYLCVGELWVILALLMFFLNHILDCSLVHLVNTRHLASLGIHIFYHISLWIYTFITLHLQQMICLHFHEFLGLIIKKGKWCFARDIFNIHLNYVHNNLKYAKAWLFKLIFKISKYSHLIHVFNCWIPVYGISNSCCIYHTSKQVCNVDSFREIFDDR